LGAGHERRDEQQARSGDGQKLPDDDSSERRWEVVGLRWPLARFTIEATEEFCLRAANWGEARESLAGFFDTRGSRA
jgi:hypothetical protein